MPQEALDDFARPSRNNVPFGGISDRIDGLRTAGQPDSRTAGQPDSRTAGQPDSRTAGQPDSRT
ncbi:hypothetical protein AB0H73_00425, partial [Streptomyces olivoreticuli]